MEGVSLFRHAVLCVLFVQSFTAGRLSICVVFQRPLTMKERFSSLFSRGRATIRNYETFDDEDEL